MLLKNHLHHTVLKGIRDVFDSLRLNWKVYRKERENDVI